MAETISVEKSFELPTDKDWEYLGNEFINNIRIYDDIIVVRTSMIKIALLE